MASEQFEKGLAVRKEAVPEGLLSEAEAQGWLVRDLTEDTG